MEFLCKVCDREILEKEYEYNNYLAALCKKNDRRLYTKYTNIMSVWMNSIKY